jgi:pentapeptide MXKDX repeat protein
MTIRTRVALGVSAAVLSLGLALAPAAFAQDKMGDKMGKDDGMKKDTMSKDNMKKDSMSKDSMSKDSMSKDGMKKDDNMMKKN